MVHPHAAAIDIGAQFHVVAVDPECDGEPVRSFRSFTTKAVTATARKIAVLFYNTLSYGTEYVDPGAAYYEERYRQRVLNNLTRRAKSLGYVLQEKAT
ncbi:hypothetical protein WJ36_30330 [Burkholderia ubonensis]|nr:hypothetical protein WJ36_30330 [Burkholderia ubonensis]